MRPLAAAAVLLLSSAGARAGAPPCGPGIDLSGRWTGYWVSDKNGHRGPLRGHFEKVSEACYRVRFSGRFWKVVPFVYTVTLSVVEHRGDSVVLSGATPLGPVLGSFRYDAAATACHFEARFTSKNDCGRFVLDRQ